MTYITRDIFQYAIYVSNWIKGSNPINTRCPLSGIDLFYNLPTNDLKGPSINLQSNTLLKSEIHGVGSNDTFLRNELDMVPGFKCVSWPPTAREWIYRTRQSGWPTDESIKEIVSEGCHVVAAAHHFSEERDLEFRFSFSLAEVALFQVMSTEQKQCYALFKAILRRNLKVMNRMIKPRG